MELDIIKLQTTWNDAAGSINSNYAKIADAIAQLKANGGGGGGISELTSKMVVDALGYTPYNSNNPANYITASALTPYAKTADVSITYATIASVQGFENRIGGLEGAVPQLNEKVSTVEGEVSSLNETVSTGENNLLDRVNTIETDYVTSGDLESAINGIDLSAYLLKADLTKSRIQSTLGISDWALASVKPTYTASEVGALGVNGTAQSALKMTPEYLTDLNSATTWRFFDMNTGYGSTDGNKPNIAWVSGITGTVASSSNYRWQLAATTGNNRPYFRQENKGDWSNWNTLAFTSDIPTKLSQFTDDVVAGKYLPLSGGTINSTAVQPLYLKNKQSNCGILFFNSTDNATLMYSGGSNWRVTDNGWSNAYYLIHSGNIGNYKSGDSAKLDGYSSSSIYVGTRGSIKSGDDLSVLAPGGYWTGATVNSTNPLPTDYASLSVLGNDYYSSQLCVKHDSTRAWIRGTYPTKKEVSNWHEVAFTDSNVASATKLKTRCKLWGNDFDGTAPVSGDLFSDIWRIIKSSNWNGTFIQSANYDGTSELGNIYMTAMHGNKLISFNVWANNSKFSDNVTVAGNVGIGNESPTEKLDVSGNIKASGNINATSITINGVTITASNGSITVNGNVFATGDITGCV